MTLTSLAVRLSILRDREQLIRHQSKLIRLLKEQRNVQQLNHTRELQGLVSAWLICLEKPELDMRDDLAALEQALGERVAVLEEHVL